MAGTRLEQGKRNSRLKVRFSEWLHSGRRFVAFRGVTPARNTMVCSLTCLTREGTRRLHVPAVQTKQICCSCHGSSPLQLPMCTNTPSCVRKLLSQKAP